MSELDADGVDPVVVSGVEQEVADRVGTGSEVVDGSAQRGERGIGHRTVRRRRPGGADVADGLADHRAHSGGSMSWRPRWGECGWS
ncbi:hypothetical protein ACWGJW_28270 [Streptomyces nigrescens]